MRRFFLSGLAIAAVSFFSTAASAATIPLTSTLDCAQATTSGAGCSGSGSATLTFDDVTKVLSWNITFSGLSAPESVSHFHGPALPGVTAGVALGLPLGDPKIGSSVLGAADEADLLADLWYINIHSSAFPGGEIRGQVLVPEPSTLALLALVAGAPFLARGRSRR